jgi:hypothetical protein
MSIRLGDLLVVQGVITSEQQQQILEIQYNSARPFGVIAEEEFGVEPGAVEQAWAAQFAMIAQRIDPSLLEIPEHVLGLVSKRQAWQFGFLPVSQDEHETVLVSTRETLARSLRFVNWRLPGVCTFGICNLKTLKRGLETHYPFPGADAAMSDRFGNQRPAA